MTCEVCGVELHEEDNIEGRWCDSDCADAAECAVCYSKIENPKRGWPYCCKGCQMQDEADWS